MDAATVSRWRETGGWLAFAGILLSGPVGVPLVSWLAPQPLWNGSEVFAANFHWLQTMPYFAGYLIISGFVVLAAGLLVETHETRQPYAVAAFAFTCVFAALISFNYIVQTTFIPAQIANGKVSAPDVVAALTMANPRSLAWAIEMWGYAFLGVATWCMAPLFAPRARLLAGMLILNGITSVLTAIWLAIDPGWVLKPIGIAAFIVWNLLIMAISVAVIIDARRFAKLKQDQ